MRHGYSDRIHTLLILLLIFVMGSAIVGLALNRSTGGKATCPRSFPQTEYTASLLWDQAGGQMGPAPEVMNEDPRDLRPLLHPEDDETCGRLRALLPDSLRLGTLAPHMAGFYQAGAIYIVPVVPNYRPAEMEALERGDYTIERRGTTYVYDAELTLLARYPN